MARNRVRAWPDTGAYIGTTAVTNAQYAAFLNEVAATDSHALYRRMMGAGAQGGIRQNGTRGAYTYTVYGGFENEPVQHASFSNVARLSNWLTTGDTEIGVYNLGGVTSTGNAAGTRDAVAWAEGGVAIATGEELHAAAVLWSTAAAGEAPLG